MQMKTATRNITLFLCGDVMTGRGIDQVLPCPGDPHIHESYLKSATGYVELAEKAHGPIPRPVPFSYVWGDALEEWDLQSPDLRLINLETSVTACDDHWPGKGINYRMHPPNVPVLTAAGIDCCSLANNHILDWGYAGLEETLKTLQDMGIKGAGAGHDNRQARAPAVFEVPGKGRVLVFAFGTLSSGIPSTWAAAEDRPGVDLLPDLSAATLARIRERVADVKRPGDLAVASIHWGGNWGFEISPDHRAFAHALIDRAGIDTVHGHSSHHVRGIEVYRGKPVIYGCGDFLTDYEGIRGYESFRGELGLMYFVSLDPENGSMAELRLAPTRVRNFRIGRASPSEARWLMEVLNREGSKLGTRTVQDRDGRLRLQWQ